MKVPGGRSPLIRLYVRKLLNDNDPSKARALVREQGLESLSLESVGWLLFVLTDDAASQATVVEMRRFLNNRVTETAGAATVASGYSDGDYLLLHSSRRADAVLVEALVVDQPDSDLITKLVRGLLGHRTAGRWGNTQKTCWSCWRWTATSVGLSPKRPTLSPESGWASSTPPVRPFKGALPKMSTLTCLCSSSKKCDRR